MKPFQSHLGAYNPTPAASAFPSSPIISEPSETLLVFDDEPMVRDVEIQILRQQGYQVLGAQGATEALRLAREAPAILITDFSKTEVDGMELTRPIPPKTSVLIVSGSFPSIQNRADDLDRFGFLAKAIQAR